MFWEEFMSSNVAWLGCFFVVSTLWTVDHMMHALRICLRQCADPADELEEEIEKLESDPAGSIAKSFVANT